MAGILKPEIDKPRMYSIRIELVRAYRDGRRERISMAARRVQDYVDDGLNDYEPYNDLADDYKGHDPVMLAEAYIQRVFHDRFLDDDEDQEYIRTGLTKSMRNSGRQLTLF